METIRPFGKTLLADLETPVTAYLKLSEKAPVSFLLESVERGRQSRFSIIGVGARRTFRLKDGVFTLNGQRVETQDPLRTLYQAVHASLGRPEGLQGAGLPEPDLPPFLGGVVGYAAYDLIRYYERLPSLKPDDLGLPDLLFVEPEVVAVFDHMKNLLHLVAPAQDLEEAEDRLLWAERRLRGPLPGVPGERPGGRARFAPDMSREEYLGAVAKALEYIRAGDIFQVVLSLRLSSPLTVHPFALYRALRSVNPSPYMGYLDLGEVVLVSASPESLLRSDGRKVVTRPIAGTRPRGKDEEEDRRLAEELLRDEKERAEHVMLLDLSRNDIGRVSAFGTVRVLEPMHVEYYSHVMHLVSTVEGILAEGKTPLDALASVLPMGTVSGAPKIRAMEIIEELEPHRRGPYGGSFGYLAYHGAMDVALTLRTFVIAGGRMHVQAGAGIVADSVPEREYEECWNKARALLKAVEMAEEGL
ncbi:anthranilate synthase component I [Thermus altitudinis]|uniref:anthranilate synthase component I n=1 Tax=Thermus altitudinis TaxID=2908145 RepID=UPI001FAA8655|nr:anthranilate synthase component I [Thermus altitudinis]